MRPFRASCAARVVTVATAVLVASAVVTPVAGAQAEEWIPPVDGSVVRAFVAPIAEYAAGHRGIDFAAAPGATVRASNDGTVSFAGTVAGALHVVVAHEGGIRTSYSFLSSVDVRAGQQVGRGDVVAQTRKVLDNMKLALAAAGATLDDVTKVTVYLANVDDRPKVNEVRKEYFKDNKPASTLIEISRFAIDGMLIEIEAIAVVR